MIYWKKQRRLWSRRLDVGAYTVLLFPLFYKEINKVRIQKYGKVVKVSIPKWQKVETVGVDA